MIKNSKFSGYYFDMNLNMWGDFQICISVPLSENQTREMKAFRILAFIRKKSISLCCTWCIDEICLIKKCLILFSVQSQK